ncbi:HPr kinase/phosphatase C-terminal domain-containing protein [Hyphomicrobium sp.]|uniref:HPr kinase/phosphorylase n=1 Tax=Hyphomicrobium sp. TaxID=82 RepID=UPI0025C088B9|nr:HPr kinase/phosphatase C-terminal domain-containing protein [Hyphomicrobium sp.]MCC7253345.1 HPr kinase/phosphatase C-terminal domain-containing protein [Hyphomicrobium sp.]
MSPSATGPELVHGTAVALGERAALIRGPSGSGKSDLALRCIATAPLAHSPHRAELVADDQVRLALSGPAIEVSPPQTIAGKIEVRGLGILTLPFRPSARLVLVVDLVPAAEVPRYPLDVASALYLGRKVPLLRFAAFESSAPVKLILALEAAADTLTAP